MDWKEVFRGGVRVWVYRIVCPKANGISGWSTATPQTQERAAMQKYAILFDCNQQKNKKQKLLVAATWGTVISCIQKFIVYMVKSKKHCFIQRPDHGHPTLSLSPSTTRYVVVNLFKPTDCLWFAIEVIIVPCDADTYRTRCIV
uniref:CBM20 domain-containing protein n=1 Tax=Loa loa TaxID=7209 RepID=A0A1I7VML4_LOALO